MLDNLDRQQRRVVLTTEGPLLVFAGAGSGKTRSIICRAAYLIKELGVPPWKLLIVTFTNKAAKELKERLSEYIDIDVNTLWVGTFHSICSSILRYEAKVNKLRFTSNFTIFDADDTKSLIKKICKEFGITGQYYSSGAVAGIISKTKNSLITVAEFFKFHSENPYTVTIRNIYEEYQNRLQENNGLDFDDLLMETALLLKNNEAVLQKYRNRFSYIMVDEYQDTNYAQFQIIQLLGSEHGNICAVGDDDQAIYSWRGASIENIINFAKDFDNAEVIRLEQNYRSTQPILDLANKLIACNCKRHPKKLWTEKREGEKPLLQVYESDSEEAKTVLQDVNEILNSGDGEGNQISSGTIAILYRTNAQSRIFETVCLELGISYKIHGSVNFFQRKEIKDVIAYLRLIINPNDSESLLRIINFPPRGIGAVTIGKVVQYAAEKNITLLQGMSESEQIETLSKRQQDNLLSLVKIIRKRQENQLYQDVPTLIEGLYDAIAIIDYYAGSSDHKDYTRLENVKEFLVAARDFSDNFGKPGGFTPAHKQTEPVNENNEDNHRQGRATLTDFLQNIALFTTTESEYDNVPDEEKNTAIVNLMTLHNAKGLEFDTVFITGLEEKLLPHQLSLETDAEIEEERRLLYVGMTRAKAKLFLSYANSRRTYYGYEQTRPSRFLKEIFPELFESKKSLLSETGQSMFRQRNYTHFKAGKETKRSRKEKKSGTIWVSENDKSYRIGQKISHREFGKGTIMSIEGKGKDAKLSILFLDGKLKKIIGTYIEILTDN